MTATDQNFVTYAGDACQATFIIVDSAGNPIDISAITEAVWSISRDLGSAAVMTKKLSLGGVVFQSDGTDGTLYVNIVSGDTSALSGFYLQIATLTDPSGNVSTFAIGRVQVGRLPAWSYSGDPKVSQRDAVRTYIGDTDNANQLLTDPVIDALIADNGSTLYAAAAGCMMLAAKYSRMVSKRVGDLSISYSDVARGYREMASDLRDQGARSGGANTIYAAGISRTDMDTYRPPEQPDAVGAFTTLDAFDDNGAIGGFMPPNTGGE